MGAAVNFSLVLDLSGLQISSQFWQEKKAKSVVIGASGCKKCGLIFCLNKSKFKGEGLESRVMWGGLPKDHATRKADQKNIVWHSLSYFGNKESKGSRRRYPL